MKVEGESQPEIGAALVVPYMVLGRPFKYQVFILKLGVSFQRSLPQKRRKKPTQQEWRVFLLFSF